MRSECDSVGLQAAINAGRKLKGIGLIMQKKQIIANIPARTIGKATFAARTEEFNCDDKGQWSNEYGNIQEADVIDICQRATNWQKIRSEHFRMHGFHN